MPASRAHPPSVLEAALLEVDARHVAARHPCEMHRQAARAAGDVEQPDTRCELELRREALELGGRLPVVLPEVLAELRGADLGVGGVAEVAVVGAVVGGGLGRVVAHPVRTRSSHVREAAPSKGSMPVVT